VIVFETKGLIELQLLSAFGVSVKETRNPIGKFGTGLKYALAVLARYGAYLEIHRGLDVYNVSTMHQVLRGKRFEFLMLSNEHEGDIPLPFTTELGEHWELWMALRELQSNTLDEDGYSYATAEPPKPHPEITRIVVTSTAFERVYEKLEQYFLLTDPLQVGAIANIHQGRNTGVYYRGVRAADLQHESLFTYDIQKDVVELTEDRTIADMWYVTHNIAKLWCTKPDLKPELLEEVLVAPSATLEGRLEFHMVGAEPSELFLNTVERIRSGGNCAALNATADELYRRKRGDQALAEEVRLDLTEEMQAAMDQAYACAQLLGYTNVRDYPVHVVNSLGAGVYGLAKNGVIYLSLRAFHDERVVSTLLEEYMHVALNFEDESRDFQNYLLYTLSNLLKKQLGGQQTFDCKRLVQAQQTDQQLKPNTVLVEEEVEDGVRDQDAPWPF
jgi:hypothetical protein